MVSQCKIVRFTISLFVVQPALDIHSPDLEHQVHDIVGLRSFFFFLGREWV